MITGGASMACHGPEAPHRGVWRSYVEMMDDMVLWFGSMRTRARWLSACGSAPKPTAGDTWSWTVHSVDAPVLELGEAGLFGQWDASVGPTTYRAGGFFCAIRTS